MELRITGVAGLGHGQALKFEFTREGETREGFVLRRGEELFAFHNRCPHWGVDLDMGEGRFFSELNQRIVCSSHGALFDPETGACVRGPCAGDQLERFGLAREGEDLVVLTIADEDPDPRW